MKNLKIIFIAFLFFSCEKETPFEPSGEYMSIIGDWKNIEGSDNSVIQIHKNGLISINRNDQRSVSIKVDSEKYIESIGDFYGSTWDWLKCKDTHRKNTTESLSFFLMKNRDTIMAFIGQTDYHVGTNNKIRFIRK